MNPTDLSSLVQAIIALLGAITVLITLYNQQRINSLHSKVDKVTTETDRIASQSSNPCDDKP